MRSSSSLRGIFGLSSKTYQFRELRIEILTALGRVVTYIYSRLFDIPFYSLVPYISERLSLETDFENEANNSEMMARLVDGEPRLRGRVYIPKIYRELTSKRVMTAEWIRTLSRARGAAAGVREVQGAMARQWILLIALIKPQTPNQPSLSPSETTGKAKLVVADSVSPSKTS